MKARRLRIWHVEAGEGEERRTIGYFPDRTAHCAMRQALDLLDRLGKEAVSIRATEVQKPEIEW